MMYPYCTYSRQSYTNYFTQGNNNIKGKVSSLQTQYLAALRSYAASSLTNENHEGQGSHCKFVSYHLGSNCILPCQKEALVCSNPMYGNGTSYFEIWLTPALLTWTRPHRFILIIWLQWKVRALKAEDSVGV